MSSIGKSQEKSIEEETLEETQRRYLSVKKHTNEEILSKVELLRDKIQNLN